MIRIAFKNVVAFAGALPFGVPAGALSQGPILDGGIIQATAGALGPERHSCSTFPGRAEIPRRDLKFFWANVLHRHTRSFTCAP